MHLIPRLHAILLPDTTQPPTLNHHKTSTKGKDITVCNLITSWKNGKTRKIILGKTAKTHYFCIRKTTEVITIFQKPN